MSKSICRLAAASAMSIAAMFAATAVAQAQTYPDKPVTIVVPYPPGGSTDVMARLMQSKMAEVLGQPIVIENRPGAAGNNGTAHVARAEADGYTTLLTVMAPITLNPAVFKDMPYDPETDLRAISQLANNILALAIHPKFEVNSVDELIEYARANPGKVRYGSAGIASAHHIAGELINKAAGVQLVHVPYPGGGPAIADLIGGHIEMSFGTLPAVVPHAEAGAIKILALVENERHASMPDIPTVAESIPIVDRARWIGFFAPAGTPDEVIARLNEAAVAALEQPDVIQKIEALGLDVIAGSPEDLDRIVRDDLAFWKKTLPEIGVTQE